MSWGRVGRVRGGPDPALAKQLGSLDANGRKGLWSTSRRRSEGIARDRGAAFRTACARFYGPGSHPAKPLRAAAAARGARMRTRDLSPTDRRTAEELRDTRGSRAVQVLLALAAPKKGHGAPGAGCPVINYGYSRRRPGLEAVCINFGQRYAAATPYRPALAA